MLGEDKELQDHIQRLLLIAEKAAHMPQRQHPNTQVDFVQTVSLQTGEESYAFGTQIF
jgi:predicted YcjX-like family ATPase